MIPPGVPIVTAAQMRAAEEAVFRREPQEDVMERAGAAVAREAARFAHGSPILVLAGPGNNGGDAYVAARLLKAAGHDVAVAASGEPGTGVARAMHARWEGEVGSLYQARPRPVLVDGLFGTGLTRPLERGIAPVFAELVASARFSLAIDLPSGLATDSGADLGAPRGISATLALGALKPAHVLDAGLDRCGHVLHADIGIPVESPRRTVARPRLAAPGTRAHKYSRGLVVVVEGDMPGAARLAAHAAMAGGAGYTILAGAGEPGGGPDALVRHKVAKGDDLADFLTESRIGAVVIGPGLGRDRRAEGLLKAALGASLPLVLDGDALTLLGKSATAWLQRRIAATWLTPHAGEFGRMFEGEGSKIEQSLAFALESKAVIVHKGADTVIATPRGEVRVLAQASSWLSTAGTGDVLAGTLAAQVAAGNKNAAEAAVWLHARAAALAGPAFIADALPMHLPQAISECL
ncbi:NAD(P)H-hydrate dehydratase [Sphingomonas sp. HITSZ_GF]|uniref:NAD(P)H-hydrate dehydratase n=1 Tax=Sphingomonas sp. HITSZ_GF TaxID=3037247 RepID=UPI00240CEFC8|nr:NAD(P)H-hydrate dehydratase [Sphingomonas sp. HITSZ_GF]MDG2532686.1 NAD(P)H-hydrate dehydratase [Sphingomonas sp. HITSZ_GF]